MLTIKYRRSFKKDYKLAVKRGLDISKFEKLVHLLVNEQPLDKAYKDHELAGNYKSYRECHVQPDWLLIYKIESDNLILVLSRTGTHSDLFD